MHCLVKPHYTLTKTVLDQGLYLLSIHLRKIIHVHMHRHKNICLSPPQCLTHTLLKYYVISILVFLSAGDDDGISRRVRNTGSSRGVRIYKEKGGGRAGEREMELLGGFHRVKTRRGAPAKVCLPQHEAGDDSYPTMTRRMTTICFPLLFFFSFTDSRQTT